MATGNEYQHRVLYNWLLHDLYTKGKHDEAVALVDQQLATTGGASEYAHYIKGLIQRSQGKVTDALAQFDAACRLNPASADNAKQKARTLFLLGRHAAALEVYDLAHELHVADEKRRAAAGKAPGARVSRAARALQERGDWEIWHNKGLCHMYLGDLEAAADGFERANAIQRHDVTYLMLSKLAELRGDAEGARRLLAEALEFSPENPELLTGLGELHMAANDEMQAFNQLGKSLSHNPRDVGTLLAVASVMQCNADYDGALAKLRAVAQLAPNAPQLWNNIGMCFYGKGKAVAAISCLKRALFLAPFEWLVNYNLGIVHLAQAQPASAFHFLNAAVRLNPDLAAGFMYLGVTLSKLGDFANACTAYDKAMGLAGKIEQNAQTKADVLRIPLNYAITCHRFGDTARAARMFMQFEASLAAADEPYSVPPELAKPLEALRGLYGVGKSGSSTSLSPATSNASGDLVPGSATGAAAASTTASGVPASAGLSGSPRTKRVRLDLLKVVRAGQPVHNVDDGIVLDVGVRERLGILHRLVIEDDPLILGRLLRNDLDLSLDIRHRLRRLGLHKHGLVLVLDPNVTSPAPSTIGASDDALVASSGSGTAVSHGSSSASPSVATLASDHSGASAEPHMRTPVPRLALTAANLARIQAAHSGQGGGRGSDGSASRPDGAKASFESLSSFVSDSSGYTVGSRTQQLASMHSPRSLDLPSPRRLVTPRILSRKYQFLRTLGRGSYSLVKLAKMATTGELVAVKVLTPQVQSETVRISRETKVLNLLSHPHIASLREVQVTVDHVYMVMEYVSGGELFDYIVTRGRIREAEARRLFRQLVSAVAYCHGNYLTHRDIKLENLLLDDEVNVKLVDFGFVNEFRPHEVLETACGTPAYAAPELLSAQPYLGPHVDIWAMGVTLYAMVTGSLPFDHPDVATLYSLIRKGEFYQPPQLSDGVNALIAGMLTVDPTQRFSLDEIANHPWILEGYSGPPDTHLPHREPVVAPEHSILVELAGYGFSTLEVTHALLHNEPCLHAAVYHLACERRAAANAAAAARDAELGSLHGYGSGSGSGPSTASCNSYSSYGSSSSHVRVRTFSTSGSGSGSRRRSVSATRSHSRFSSSTTLGSVASVTSVASAGSNASDSDSVAKDASAATASAVSATTPTLPALPRLDLDKTRPAAASRSRTKSSSSGSPSCGRELDSPVATPGKTGKHKKHVKRRTRIRVRKQVRAQARAARRPTPASTAFPHNPPPSTLSVSSSRSRSPKTMSPVSSLTPISEAVAPHPPPSIAVANIRAAGTRTRARAISASSFENSVSSIDWSAVRFAPLNKSEDSEGDLPTRCAASPPPSGDQPSGGKTSRPTSATPTPPVDTAVDAQLQLSLSPRVLEYARSTGAPKGMLTAPGRWEAMAERRAAEQAAALGEGTPTSPNMPELRAVRGPFSVETTTTRSLKDTCACIADALEDCAVDFTLSNYVYDCKLALADQDDLSFTIEICRLRRMSLLGIKFTRGEGQPWIYKAQIQILLARMRL
ncbi:uncharacterized protein AMSG_12239 [Thecamonas trahens ATCC 50062]|uniref:non-specific serine/threonine protein kinase n=1 Tax=Thecamonas trahens ATCC 50062 TaxID=461836 RepID=A0A0L0DNH8_THETB|nr:hypothetical protein AMSG_12239 [Thecamonas trahens ATCC 50062]KNC52973.1 hypothetical protein AMSG_12239 [Thecamonas trahens ATCC 50062]|eukprot:XP_013754917.1 hypothetical protein AMSG_12239 [Thecamonas trahens ATCC 50062]